jgi:peptidoglycan/LPS O-acetylase OafA/YrhL
VPQSATITRRSADATWEAEEKAPTRPGGGWKHIDALDGLRGVAILLVLLDHAFVLISGSPHLFFRAIEKVTGNGWIGVDLFFVLSGYLITSILLNTKTLPNYFRNFYFRRALRIFPAYYTCLIIALVIIPHLPSRVGSSLGLLRGTTGQAWLWTYCANIKITAIKSWYFGTLDPFWSLSVEEHFYLLWPALVLMLSSRALRRVCAALIVIAPIIRAAMVFNGNEVGAYAFTLCRMDSLAWGALAAVFTHDGAKGAIAFCRRKWIYPLGLFGILALWPHAGSWQLKFDFTAGMSLLGFAFCGVVLSTVARPMRLLNNRVLKSFGKYSYGIYVWEAKFTWGLFPALAASKLGKPIMAIPFAGPIAFCLAAIPVCYAVGWLSFNLMEKHFLLLKRFFEYRKEEPKIALSRRPGESKMVGHLHRSDYGHQKDSDDRGGFLGGLRNDGPVPNLGDHRTHGPRGLSEQESRRKDQDGRA